jgi:DNA topoisomerase-3
MTKPLIIAEKPSAARAIAEALGGFSKREGYLESSQYYLSWAIGHLVELQSPEEYDPKWKRWSLESLPIAPTMFGLKVVSKTKSQFNVLVKLARTAPELINACDAAREGELIFRYICQAAGIRRPAKRLWTSSLTRDAIRKAFQALRPEKDYDRLYQSALCRAQGDWLVGINATRAFTVKWGELLSVGRVQTPTLALIVRREREIAVFKPEAYWEVHADLATIDGRKYKGKWFGPTGDRLPNRLAADAIAQRTHGAPGVVESVEEKESIDRPPQLYDLTTLQREANRKFGLTAAATLKSAQNLYEAKLITYPRTDSRYMTRDLVPGLPAVVRAVGTLPEFAAAAQGADLALVHSQNRRVVDDSKVSDHHAILPTTEVSTGLTAIDAKVYGLIVRRFLAQFYPDARYREVTVISQVGSEPDRFRSRGRRLLTPGWRVCEPEVAAKKDDPEEIPNLPALTQGEPVVAKKVVVLDKETQPPKRFTEANLLSAMEYAGRDMDDEALKEAMKGRGLGTPATRASIIERLKDVGYILTEKKALVPTSKGHRLVDLAEAAGAQVLLSAELTGEWEKRIADIQAGGYDPDRFMREVRELATTVVELMRKSPGGAPQAGGRREPVSGSDSGLATDSLPVTAGKCPKCGRVVIKGTRVWACVNSECPVRIPTWLCGKTIDASLAGALLTKGQTPIIEGFKSPRTGKIFRARLLFKEGAVAFDFPTETQRKPSGYRARTTEETDRKPTAAAKTRSRSPRASKSPRTVTKPD